MPDIAGVFTRTDGTFNGATVWTQEKNAAQLVTAAHFDTHDQDMANALNNRVFADGTTTGVVSLNLTATVNSATGVITIGGVTFANMLAGGGTGNLFVGNAGNFSLTGGANIGIGYGVTNVPGFGTQPLIGLTSGAGNIAIGAAALAVLSTGLGNVAIGPLALNLATGSGNVAIGQDAGQVATSGSNNTLIGNSAGSVVTSGSNNVVIGHLADASVPTASNQLSIQNAIYGTGNTGTGNTPGSGKIGINNAAPAYTLDVAGNIAATVAGNGFRVTEGSNAKQGTATLVLGTVTVSNTSVTATSRIFVNGLALNASTALGTLSVPTITAGTSFIIRSYIPGGVSTQTGDLRTVVYEIFEIA